MPSTATTRNRLEKQAPGENRNTWGTRFNANFADLLDYALDGMVSFTLSGSKTLTAEDFAADEARGRYINVTGGTGGTVTIPDIEKAYLIRNASSGNVTITTGSGTTAVISSGAVIWAVCEGDNVVRQQLIPVTAGGTGATSASAARTNLGLGGLAVLNTINNANWSGTDLAIVNGGTGASDAATARTNLGLGSLATLNAVNNSNWSGTALAVTNGGTGATSASAARTNLGLGSLATLNSVNNSNWSGAALSVANGGTGGTTAAAARTNLELGALATLSAINNSNWSGTALAVANGGTGATTASAARTNLGLGTLATASTINDANWSGTDLAVANGGTGASTAADARTNLGLGTMATESASSYATLASPALTGTPTAPTAAAGTNTTQIATTAFVDRLRDVARRTSGVARGECLAATGTVALTTGQAAGSTFSIYNNSASAISITQGSGLTLRLAGTTTTGNRTLAARGMATVWCNSTTEYVIQGSGLS